MLIFVQLPDWPPSGRTCAFGDPPPAAAAVKAWVGDDGLIDIRDRRMDARFRFLFLGCDSEIKELTHGLPRRKSAFSGR